MKTKRNLSASIPNETRKAVYARDGYRCALCDDTHGLQIHHIVHRSVGGNDTPCNLITLCWRPSAPAPPPGFGPGAGLFCFRCGGFGDCAACGRR